MVHLGGVIWEDIIYNTVQGDHSYDFFFVCSNIVIFTNEYQN